MIDLVRSVYDNQEAILTAVVNLHCSGRGFDCDISYGNGGFYTGELKKPKLRFDIDGTLPDVTEASSTRLPLNDDALESCVFDPPFLTYIREKRTGNGAMALANRFSGYWRYDELLRHYEDTVKEVSRVLKNNGVLIFKCQDIVHNHRLQPTHMNVFRMCAENKLRLLDLFILTAGHRMPSPNRAGVQKHARIFHSYFMVFKKEAK